MIIIVSTHTYVFSFFSMKNGKWQCKFPLLVKIKNNGRYTNPVTIAQFCILFISCSINSGRFRGPGCQDPWLPYCYVRLDSRCIRRLGPIGPLQLYSLDPPLRCEHGFTMSTLLSVSGILLEGAM